MIASSRSALIISLIARNHLKKMPSNDYPSLRARLRGDTYTYHKALDAEVSRFDLAKPGGLSSFLRMQASALRSVRPHVQASASFGAIEDLLERAESDLARLGTLGMPIALIDKPLHPAAVDYVVTGSRLGAQILRRKWQATDHPDVLLADAYFSAPSYLELWKSFCMLAASMSAHDGEADEVVGDACKVFRLYHECALSSQGRKEETRASV